MVGEKSRYSHFNSNYEISCPTRYSMNSASPILTKINYGPLISLIKSTEVTEIMVNAWDKIFVEHNGKTILTPLKFEDLKAFEYFIRCILDQQIDGENPNKFTFDGMLPEGYRFNITLPPVTPHSCTITIRKFSDKIFTLENLITKKTLTDKAAIFLKEAILNKLTIVISGGTGSGKTSFINTLSNFIPQNERVVSIEDTQELKTLHPNWVHMVTSKNISARDCLVNSLRMRPDRIIIGECRGPEAYDFLQAINTGHEGSLTSIHANSAIDCLSRLENLVSLGHSDVPLKYIRHQIATSVDLVIQLRRLPSGQRQIVDIIELTGMESEIITRGNIFTVDKSSQQLETTGYVPDCLSRMDTGHSNIDTGFFESPHKAARTA